MNIFNFKKIIQESLKQGRIENYNRDQSLFEDTKQSKHRFYGVEFQTEYKEFTIKLDVIVNIIEN